MPIFQMRTLRHRDMKGFPQDTQVGGHRAGPPGASLISWGAGAEPFLPRRKQAPGGCWGLDGAGGGHCLGGGRGGSPEGCGSWGPLPPQRLRKHTHTSPDLESMSHIGGKEEGGRLSQRGNRRRGTEELGACALAPGKVTAALPQHLLCATDGVQCSAHFDA